MVVCPACGERATMESYEAWTPKDGWKKLERISCNNVRPKNGEPCGKKTVLKEIRLEREATPVMSTVVVTPPARRSERRHSGGRHAEEQPIEPSEAAEAEENESDESEEVEVESQASMHSEPEERPASIEQPSESPNPVDDSESNVPDPSHMLEANNDAGNRRFPKYSPEQYQKLIDLVESGMTCPQASQSVGIQVNTAYGIIGKYRRGLRESGPVRNERRTVLTLVPPRTSVQVRVPMPETPFKTSTLLNQLKEEGIETPGRMLSSTDLAAFFRLPEDVQEGLRMFHAMRQEVAVAEEFLG